GRRILVPIFFALGFNRDRHTKCDCPLPLLNLPPELLPPHIGRNRTESDAPGRALERRHHLVAGGVIPKSRISSTDRARFGDRFRQQLRPVRLFRLGVHRRYLAASISCQLSSTI